jgi:uncharacterized protein (TIGR00369 family)
LPELKPLNPGFEAAVRENFARQAFMSTLGASLTQVGPGTVHIRVPFSSRLTQQNGFLHAGVITSIADSACGYAALSLAPPGQDVLSVEFKINLLRPAVAQEFLASGQVLRAGRTLTVAFAEVVGVAASSREVVATMLSTIMVRATVPSQFNRAPTFLPGTAGFTGRIRLNGPVERVFPLFSPVGEKSWVPGWDPELLHPPGASWRDGLIFRTAEDSGPAVWIVSDLDVATHRVTYHRVEPSLYVARIDVTCEEVSAGVTDVSTAYTFVGLSEEGNRAISAMTALEYEAKMTRWTTWLEHHLKGGARE